ncbi:hypothetical protein SARC_08976, partial [Sphaeroforma arctica JP610]
LVSMEWRWHLFRGIVAFLFSVSTFCAPGMTLFVFLCLFSATMAVQGIFSVAFGLYVCNGWVFFSGLFDISISFLTLTYQDVTALTVLYFVAFRMLFYGLYFVSNAWISPTSQVPQEVTFALGTNGLFFILGGLCLVVMHPAEGVLVLLWIVALQALFDSVHSLLIARALYKLQHSHYAPAPTLETA